MNDKEIFDSKTAGIPPEMFADYAAYRQHVLEMMQLARQDERTKIFEMIPCQGFKYTGSQNLKCFDQHKHEKCWCARCKAFLATSEKYFPSLTEKAKKKLEEG